MFNGMSSTDRFMAIIFMSIALICIAAMGSTALQEASTKNTVANCISKADTKQKVEICKALSK